MEREIRFRAWISRAGEMASWEMIQEKQNLHRLIVNHEYPLMQFTGLKDMNGEDIYEGDIVKQVHVVPEVEITSFCAVEFTNGAFIVNDKKFTELTPLNESAYCCEVVGNIYENRELITKYVE